MQKKILIGAGAAFVVMGALEFLTYGMFGSYWEEVAHLMRPEADIKMWIVVLTWAFFAYFFTWIFSKGYENKGVMEGVRYGLAVALMMVVPWAYGTYAYMKDFPYHLALIWFLVATVEIVACGAAVAWIFGRKTAEAS